MVEPLSPRPGSPTEDPERPHSPTSPFFLLSNDDQLERAQARAARAAAIRRKAIPVDPPSAAPDTCLSRDQIMDLFQNCIKLASENKINRKNTWELRLIDHLSEILKVEGQVDAETNFQKASFTLEAGVKIYSLRVDSVHADAYKVLAGMIRASHGYEQEYMTTDVNNSGGPGASHVKKDKKISPLSTLESSFESLNAKKFDVAFAVDPVYHQMSARFDGGAKGLLFNNLGIYGKCQVLFDSLELPGKCRSSSSQNPDMNHMIDISFAQELIEHMLMNMPMKKEISPSLQEIISQFAEANIRSSQTFDVDQEFDVEEDVFNDDATSFGNYCRWDFDHDESAVHGSSSSEYPSFQSYPLVKDPYTMDEADADDNAENGYIFLFQKLGLSSKQNAWAGPDYWKYHKSIVEEGALPTESESSCTAKKLKNRNIIEGDSGFMEHLEREVLAIFSPPRNPNSLLLPANRAPCCNTLPEDCHYQPENLAKLFLLPNCLCLGKRRRELSDYSWHQSDNLNEGPPSWDNESVLSVHYDNSYVPADVENSDELVSQPRQVDKTEVQYDRTSKQIDVDVLKETLWGHIRGGSTSVPETGSKNVISFKDVLGAFSVDRRWAAAQENISPHLCFICLLHLANEHGLNVKGCPDLDDLAIQLPSPIANL